MTAAPAVWAGYTSIGQVQAAALTVISDVRTCAPHANIDVLTVACRHEPTRMAQILICLAAWVGDDVLMSELARRATITAAGNPHVEILDRRPGCPPKT